MILPIILQTMISPPLTIKAVLAHSYALDVRYRKEYFLADLLKQSLDSLEIQYQKLQTEYQNIQKMENQDNRSYLYKTLKLFQQAIEMKQTEITKWL